MKTIDQKQQDLIESLVDSGITHLPILTKNGSAYVALVDARKLDYYHALEAEHGRLLMLNDAEKGLRDALAGRVQSEDDFSASLRRPGSAK
jgi:hypothetical protein